MFSNGEEYRMFLDMYCFRCNKYVPFEEATAKRPVCPIEEKLALCSFTGEEKHWPKQVKRADGGCWKCSQWVKEKGSI